MPGISVPMADTGPYILDLSIHNYLMFAPFIIIFENPWFIVQGLLLYCFGPWLSGYLFCTSLMDRRMVWSGFLLIQVH